MGISGKVGDSKLDIAIIKDYNGINFTIASSIWQAVNVSPRYRKLLNVAIVKLTKILKLSQLKQAVSHVVPWDTACSFFVPS